MGSLKQSQSRTTASEQNLATSTQTQHLERSNTLQEVLGSRAASRRFRNALRNQPRAIQAKPLFRGLSHELVPTPSSEMVVQAKMIVRPPGDRYEQEADRVAEQVIQQMHSSPASPSNQSAATQSPVQAQASQLEAIQPKAIQSGVSAEGGIAVTPELEASIGRARSGGQPLPDRIREPMERALGADFSGVRVHTNTQSDQLNRSISAQAFTTGQDIFFRQGTYEPGSRSGQALIAHELTHVAQQRHAPDQAPSTASQDQLPNSHSASGNRYDLIQRLSYRDKPINLSNLDNLYKAEGGRRGVYVAQENNDRVIIKLDDEPQGGDDEFTNRLIEKGVGLSVPGVRAVFPTDLDWQTVMDAVKTWASRAQPETRIKRDATEDIATTKVILLMEELRGTDFVELLRTPEGRADIIAALGKPTVVQSLGRLAVIDGFLRNYDRLTAKEGSNLGNFMLSADQQSLLTLDSHADRLGTIIGVKTLKDVADRMGSQMTFLEDALNRQENKCVNTFFATLDGIEQRFTNSQTLKPQLDLIEPQVTAWFYEGVTAGAQTLLTSLTQGKNEYKQDIQDIRQNYPGETTTVSWDTIVARRQYLFWRTQAHQNVQSAKQAAAQEILYRRWKREFLSIIAMPPESLTITPKPESLSPQRKAKRAAGSRSKVGKQLDPIKSGIRSGKPTEEQLNQLAQYEQTPKYQNKRRVRKALYLRDLYRFIDIGKQKVAALEQLLDEQIPAWKASEELTTAEALYALKKLRFVWASTVQLHSMVGNYSNACVQWADTGKEATEVMELRTKLMKLEELIEKEVSIYGGFRTDLWYQGFLEFVSNQ